jgi:hypothetical protein
MFFHCDYCFDYIASDVDHLVCACGRRWCSIRCAKLEGYQDRKTTSCCRFCDGKTDNFNDLLYFSFDLRDNENNNE